MRRFKSLHFAMLALGSVCLNFAYASSEGLQSLSDSEMSATTGQALMSLSYISPTDSANLMRNISGSNNIGFYKLGLEAELELNANIKNSVFLNFAKLIFIFIISIIVTSNAIMVIRPYHGTNCLDHFLTVLKKVK